MRALCECEATCLPAAAKRFITARLASAAALPSRRPSWLAYNLSRRIGKGEESMAEEIRAPLAGTVLSVLVEPGAKVDDDDELLVIEALKMENLVYCALRRHGEGNQREEGRQGRRGRSSHQSSNRRRCKKAKRGNDELRTDRRAGDDPGHRAALRRGGDRADARSRGAQARVPRRARRQDGRARLLLLRACRRSSAAAAWASWNRC